MLTHWIVIKMTEFSDIEKLILSKLDNIERNVSDICGRLTTIETSFGNHLTTELAKANHRFKYLTIIIGLIGIPLVILNTLRTLGII